MFEEVECKECGELESVQSGSEQWNHSLCYHCYEEEEILNEV